MIEWGAVLALAAYIGWLRFSHRRRVDRLLEHAAGLQAELQALRLKGE